MKGILTHMLKFQFENIRAFDKYQTYEIDKFFMKFEFITRKGRIIVNIKY